MSPNEAVEELAPILPAWGEAIKGVGVARHKMVNMSPRLLPVDREAQLISRSSAHAVNRVVDASDQFALDAQERNAANDALAYAPSMLQMAIPLANS
ncbi:MAG: hypothetical protein ABIO49_02775 [Dokdonella sp.]